MDHLSIEVWYMASKDPPDQKLKDVRNIYTIFLNQNLIFRSWENGVCMYTESIIYAAGNNIYHFTSKIYFIGVCPILAHVYRPIVVCTQLRCVFLGCHNNLRIEGYLNFLVNVPVVLKH